MSRTWTHLLAEAAGYPINPRLRIPDGWREYASRRTGQEAPDTMTDGREPVFARFESGFNPSDPVDRAIFATRAAVFPEHGLMPEPSQRARPAEERPRLGACRSSPGAYLRQRQ